MLAGLIGDLVPPDEPADVLILGFAVPDVRPERATAAFLSAACPGRPLAFAVCDQGCAAGFTALRLARDYAADGGAGRVLVALAEQTRLDYDPPAPASLPAGHAAFAVLCDARPAPAQAGTADATTMDGATADGATADGATADGATADAATADATTMDGATADGATAAPPAAGPADDWAPVPQAAGPSHNGAPMATPAGPTHNDASVPTAAGAAHEGARVLTAVRLLPGVAAGLVPAVLRRELAGLPVAEPGDDKHPLVLGEGLAPLVGGDLPGWRPVPLPPGQPLTGVWRELAAWSAGPDRGALVIADYDPGLRYLCLAGFATT
jgi:hypothetical protein